MKQGLVSIIIVNWNGLSWLSDCLTSLEKQDYKNYEIIFVDNASDDNSVGWVKHHYPKIRIIVNKKNLGFADANNVGYQAAKGTYILFLNNDTKVTKNFIAELINVLDSDPRIGGAQGKILLMGAPSRLDSIGAFLTPTGFLYHYGFGKKDVSKYNKQIDMYTAKGACMMFKRSVLEKIKVEGDIFDPDFFAYFEESDLCHRVWLSGYRIVYAYKSVVYHKVGATSTRMDNSFIQYHSFKNRISTYVKNFGVENIWRILPLHIVICIFFSFVSLFEGQWRIFCSIQRAIFWNVINVSKILSKRSYIQHNIRMISDDRFRHVIVKPRFSYYLLTFKGHIDMYED